MDIKNLKTGDKVLVECTVQAVFANSKMVMVTTRDCTEGFDAYIDEIQEPLEQEPQTFKWCTDCKEYDQEKHCCHRWSKAIRDTIKEMKQEYIEREVLDKIRAEIERQEKWLMDAGYNQYNVDIALDAIKSVVDKCKAEVEPQESEG